MDVQYSPVPVSGIRCQLGENPLWCEVRQALLWTDISAGRLYEHDLLTGQSRQIYSGEPVGGFTVQEDDSLLLFQVNEISVLFPNGDLQVLMDDIDPDMKRFNDVIADPWGRVYAGTIGQDSRKGGLYRIDPNGKITNLFKGTGNSNGMGFSPDCRYFYWTDTTARRIFRFRHCEETGELSEREVLIEIPSGKGVPDGMTVDSQGYIWSARWGDAAVYRYSPDGREIGKVALPTLNVTSVAFGGEMLRDLYITTAGGKDGVTGPEGAVYRVGTTSLGRLEYRSRVMLDR